MVFVSIYFIKISDTQILIVSGLISVLGRPTKEKNHQLILFIYDDGTVEKRITVE